MKWKIAPVSWIKLAAASMSAMTMCLAPVAQGAEAANQRKMISQYLKETGLSTKQMTVGEYWSSVRHVYPPKIQSQIDQWVALNRNEMMPKIEASSIKGSDGKEQVRLNVFKDGQTATMTFTGDEENPLKVNGVTFSKNELSNTTDFNSIAKKMMAGDKKLNESMKKTSQPALGKNFILSKKEFKQLTARQKAEYLVKARLAMESADKVYETFYGKDHASLEVNNKYEWVQQFVLGHDVYAASLTGKPCIVAGYLSVYGENGSCGGNTKGAADLKKKMSASSASCSGGAISCNPMVYGFDKSGSAFCVSRSEVKYATRVCNQKSPLKGADEKTTLANKKRIIESYLSKQGKTINLELNDKGEISEEQYSEISSYLTDLQGFVNSAIGECDKAPLKDIQKTRADQVSACNEIKTRAFTLQSFAVNPIPPPPPAPLPNECEAKEGSVAGPEGKGCVCPEGTKDGGDKDGCLVIETGVSGEAPAEGGKVGKGVEVAGKADECGFWCRNKNWLIPVMIGGAALGIFALLLKSSHKSKSKDYVPPASLDGNVGGTDEVPVPEAPVAAPCESPNTYVNGICTPPSVVPVSEGGTIVDSTIRSGGVRGATGVR